MWGGPISRYLCERLRTAGALLVAWMLVAGLCARCFAALWRAVAGTP